MISGGRGAAVGLLIGGDVGTREGGLVGCEVGCPTITKSSASWLAKNVSVSFLAAISLQSNAATSCASVEAAIPFVEGLIFNY